MSTSPTPAPTKRKRGGQPGNASALRHGFYAKSFTDAEMGRLDKDIEGEFLDEIALARLSRVLCGAPMPLVWLIC